MGSKPLKTQTSATQSVPRTSSITDLYSVLSTFQLQNMANSKGKFWRRRGGSSRMSLTSNKSKDSSILVDVEEEFLHAAEFGDIPTVRRLLGDNPDLNVDCIDALGRTALRLAVKNEHLEIVEVLLEKSSSRHIYEAVLQAISAGHVQIAENILKHKRYLELWKERKKLGDDDHFFKTQFEESQFSPDITPLILASQKNQYEIVQILLLRGEKISNPHKFGCMCRECVNKMKFDQLRSAKYRLNAYRGLASEAYISLSSKDPILTAFQLSKELKDLSSSEKYFKLEYKELRNQLSEYVVKLLDRVRNQEELEIVLNKTGKPEEENYSDLARLSLAIQFMEKKFVAHPSCQQRLDKSWYEGIGPFLKAGVFFVAHPSCQQRLDKSWYEGIGPFLKPGVFVRVLMFVADPSCQQRLDKSWYEGIGPFLKAGVLFDAHPSCQQRLDKSWYEGIGPFLKAGVFFRVLMFVAHPSCQQRLDKSWYEGIGPFLKAGVFVRVLMFVAHPSCQQRLDKSWYEGIGPFLKAGVFVRVLMIFSFIIAYPFLALCYIFLPSSKIKFLRVLRFPWIKFVVHSASYIIFLVLIIVTTAEATYVRRENLTLATSYANVHSKYMQLQNLTNQHLFGPDVPIRQALPTTTQMLILVWTFGFLYHECCQITTEGISTYCRSMYNLVDSGLLILYASSFTLKYLVMFKVHLGINYFKTNTVDDLYSKVGDSTYNLYWITADRYYWDKWDPVNLSEGLFAIANILGFSRISYLLPANEALGPLQISLGRMLKDIFKCLCLIALVLCAFVIGLQNLYWYYNTRESIELETRTFDVPAQESFGDTIRAFRTVFWSLYGRGEATAVTLGAYENHVTEDIGYLIYGLYNVVMVTVLFNMLIAMMARSFQAIAEESDVEWKFARSQLYLEYISEDEVLPVPLNLARFPRSVIDWIFDCGKNVDKKDDVIEEPFDIYNNANVNGRASPPGPKRRNGMDQPLSDISQIAAHLRTSKTPSNSSMDLSVVDIYEANRSGPILSRANSDIGRKHRHSIPGILDGNKGYQKVVQRIIQRYIFDIQREAEVTEDDFEEIKQDISSFRYEMLSVTKNREQQMIDINNQLARLTAAVTGTPEDSEQVFRSKFQIRATQLRNKLMKQGSRTSLLDSQSPSEDLEDGYETGDFCRDTDKSDPDLKTIISNDENSKSENQDNPDSIAGSESINQDGHAGELNDEVVEAAKTSDDEECFVVDNHGVAPGQ